MTPERLKLPLEDVLSRPPNQNLPVLKLNVSVLWIQGQNVMLWVFVNRHQLSGG